MAWSELDLEKGTWTLPKARSKNGRGHTLPLMPETLAIIRSVPHRADRDQLFGERHPAGFSAWDRFKRLLDDRLDISEPWVLHDIRRSVASTLGDLGVAPHVIEEILGHAGYKSRTAATYNKSRYANEVRAALALWADHVNTLVTGGERKVLPLRRTE